MDREGKYYPLITYAGTLESIKYTHSMVCR